MLECLILGDSIAVGTHQQRPECVAYAKGGINSWQWTNKNITRDLTAKTVIISLGSNDHAGVKTHRELLSIRELTKAERVYWILPAGNLKASGVDISKIQASVHEISKQYGDVVLPFQPSRDGIHPTAQGYRELAKAAR
jgi:lysophospholipase L1-like esterase